MEAFMKRIPFFVLMFTAAIIVFAETGKEDYAQVLGRSMLGYHEAKLDAISNLASLVGSSDMVRIWNFFYAENSGKPVKNTSSQENLEITQRLVSVLPPLSKIKEYKDKDTFFCELQVQEKDIERIKEILDIIILFPHETIRAYPTAESFFQQEILQINTIEAQRLSAILEKEFLLTSHVIDNRIYLYPRSKYENKIISFLRPYTFRINRQGNRFDLDLSIINFLSDTTGYRDVRKMLVSSSPPIPELNVIIKENGLNPVYQAGKERFLLSIDFKKNEKSHGISVRAEVSIVDEQNSAVLARHVIQSNNYARHVADKIISGLEKQIIDYVQKTLPLVLANY
jgi:hypothetical protein